MPLACSSQCLANWLSSSMPLITPVFGRNLPPGRFSDLTPSGLGLQKGPGVEFATSHPPHHRATNMDWMSKFRGLVNPKWIMDRFPGTLFYGGVDRAPAAGSGPIHPQGMTP